LAFALARLGDAYRSYLLKKVTGVSFVVTLGTVLAERLLDTFVLARMMDASLLVVFGGSLSMEATQLLSAGLVLCSFSRHENSSTKEGLGTPSMSIKIHRFFKGQS
jgi:hypothetical protein